MTGNQFTVSEVARRAHVSVRTLHHCDAIGLLAPARRSAAGYRLYDDADLCRLHEIPAVQGARLSTGGDPPRHRCSAERAAAYFEKRGEGLTTFVAAAIRANAG